MPRFTSPLFAALAATLLFAPAAGTQPPMRPAMQAEPPLPGFHTAGPAEVPRPVAAARLHPRPAPLADNDFAMILPRLGLQSKRITLPGVYSPNLKYQLESYSTSFGAEVETTTLTDSIFYGATGYVQIDFNVLPGRQQLLDCSLGEDGTYKIATMFFLANGNTPFLSGSIGSFSRHLVVPLNTSPANARSARIIVSFNEIEFDGCQVETVQ